MSADTLAYKRAPTNPTRIFWLGAHKLLVGTELNRLRDLGYEVFNPPYLSRVLDQSAEGVWNNRQSTTLPKEVFLKLSRYNFFYNQITPEIAELLNYYFDGVVVTILARWAAEILRAYKGPCVFRTYGQTSSLSDDFTALGFRMLIESRENFVLCPHADETLEFEEEWLIAKSRVVPYCLSSDLQPFKDKWQGNDNASGEILVTAPNIGNNFHRGHYNFLKEYFYHDHYRFCGIQPSLINDRQVVGSLGRLSQIKMFLTSNGYFYSYRDPRVVYLPPIEMITFGGPVVYFSGSLLARYIGPGGAGEANSISAAHTLCSRLLANDQIFIAELKDSQRSVSDRYAPETVWPVFDQMVTDLIPIDGDGRSKKQLPLVVQLRKSIEHVLIHLENEDKALIDADVSELQELLGSCSRTSSDTKNEESEHFLALPSFAMGSWEKMANGRGAENEGGTQKHFSQHFRVSLSISEGDYHLSSMIASRTPLKEDVVMEVVAANAGEINSLVKVVISSYDPYFREVSVKFTVEHGQVDLELRIYIDDPSDLEIETLDIVRVETTAEWI